MRDSGGVAPAENNVLTSGEKSSIEGEAEAAAELLREYLRTSSESSARALLNRLFSEHLDLWSRDAAVRALRSYGVRGDVQGEASDLAADVMLQITIRLSEMRKQGAGEITNLRGYVRVSVQNACFGRIRARCPRHVQLQNRIRYLVRTDPRFAEWTDENGDQLAGLRDWRGREERAVPVVPQRSGDSLAEVLLDLFQLTGCPLRLVELTGAVASVVGIVEDSKSSGALIPVAQASADDVMIDREQLRSLWSEVTLLPLAQRCALLLNLRDASGCGVIEWIPGTGTANFTQLAEILNMTPKQLAEIWPELPLEDAKIAEMLGLTRQQVINLRKAARNRLARRTATEGNTGRSSASSVLERGFRAVLGWGRKP